MECEIGAIRADHEAKVEQLEEELRLERETRTQTQNKSVEFQQKIEVHEKEKLSMTAQVQDLQERVRKLEMQLSSQILQPSPQLMIMLPLMVNFRSKACFLHIMY